MTEICEKVFFSLASDDDNGCPFCPGEEVKHEYVSYGGAKNNVDNLRWNMAQPSHAREKEKESKTLEKSNGYPSPIKSPVDNSGYKKKSSIKGKLAYENDEHGIYGYEAHHCISGNEILKGTALDKVITNEGGKFKGQTGYTINNATNGVFLPSFPRKYFGKWEPMDEKEKYKIMALAMDAGEGQAHIGCHTGHDNDGGKDYPTMIKEELAAISKRVSEKTDECPFCVENGSHKKPFIPPYKINQWLDVLSNDIKNELLGPVESWPYFISGYAKDYYKEKMGSVDSLDQL